MARAQGARAQMALAFETTYGTPPASGYSKMPFANASLGAEQPLQTSELLGYGRDPQAPIKDAVTADGNVVMPIDTEAFGFWLKAAFGHPDHSKHYQTTLAVDALTPDRSSLGSLQASLMGLPPYLLLTNSQYQSPHRMSPADQKYEKCFEEEPVPSACELMPSCPPTLHTQRQSAASLSLPSMACHLVRLSNSPRRVPQGRLTAISCYRFWKALCVGRKTRRLKKQPIERIISNRHLFFFSIHQ